MSTLNTSDDNKFVNLKWITRYFRIAEQVSMWSKDPSTKVGAIIVGDKGQIISQGYNGFPRGVNDSEERYHNRELKYKLVVHAEMNAILNALYNGSSVVGATLYVHALPVCQECAKAIIQAGISTVYIDTNISERWKESWQITKTMFSESKVACYYFDMNANTVERQC
jgi:dCMP deaminase